MHIRYIRILQSKFHQTICSLAYAPTAPVYINFRDMFNAVVIHKRLLFFTDRTFGIKMNIDFKPSVQFRCQLQYLINILVCQNEHCLHTLFLFSIKLVYQLSDCVLDIVSGTHLFSNYLRITLYLIILFAAEFV